MNFYLAAVEDGGKAGQRIGCGDSLLAVKRMVNSRGGAVLKAVLGELLSVPPEYDARLKNYGADHGGPGSSLASGV